MQSADIVFEQSDHKAREHRPRQQGVDKEEDRQDHREGIDKATNRRTTFYKRRIPKATRRRRDKITSREYTRQQAEGQTSSYIVLQGGRQTRRRKENYKKCIPKATSRRTDRT